jgi:hypothetical protein
MPENTLEAAMDTPALVLLAIAALVTFGYWLWGKARPFKTCRKCGGYGRLARRLGPPKDCRTCKGTGLRTRTSRKAARATRRTITNARR